MGRFTQCYWPAVYFWLHIRIRTFWLTAKDWLFFMPFLDIALLLYGISHIHKGKINLRMFSCPFSVIGLNISFIMQIKITFHPLYKLKIVLVFGFWELLNIDIFQDFALWKAQLQYFEVVDKLPFIWCRKAYSLKRYFSGVHYVKNLAINSASTQLLDSS